ncbi:MAG TPA: DAK2 domain-containing protein, partial [Trebonia sp.]|nr:DAK2 domain-containing protein [Trebonia sp.]
GRPAAPSAAGVADAVDEAARAVQRVGRCRPGDKTLLDALLPVATALRRSAADDDSPAQAARAAAEAAADAAAATAQLIPRVGRARPLGRRSIGTPDPGATSLALCAAAVAEVVAAGAAAGIAREGAQ